MDVYISTLGAVECRPEPMSDGRFAAIVILTHPIPGGHDVLRHQCLGSDAEPGDAVARARAWAERNFPPSPEVLRTRHPCVRPRTDVRATAEHSSGRTELSRSEP